MAESVNTSNEEILTVSEAADFCKVSEWGMYKRVKKGTAPAHYMGKRIYFIKSELIASGGQL